MDVHRQNEFTLRQLVDMVTGMAAHQERGLDTPFRFGVCDGNDVSIVSMVDTQECERVSKEDARVVETFVAIRLHLHGPGIERWKGVTNDVDEELRQLTEEEGNP